MFGHAETISEILAQSKMLMVSFARLRIVLCCRVLRDPMFGLRFTVRLRLRRSFTRALTMTARFLALY